MNDVYIHQGESDTFVMGMAAIFWGLAWSHHAEKHHCYNLSGCEITKHMPEIPEIAWRLAERWAGRIEQANGLGLATLFFRAMAADGQPELTHDDYHGETAERFGECLGYMVQGCGVSWFDDHQEFDLKVPHDAGEIETALEAYAAEQCKDVTGYIPCRECGAYVAEYEKCKECGTVDDA